MADQVIVMSDRDQEDLKSILTRNDLDMVVAVIEQFYNRAICDEGAERLRCSHITDEDARPEGVFRFGKFSVMACSDCFKIHSEGVLRAILQNAALQMLNKA